MPYPTEKSDSSTAQVELKTVASLDTISPDQAKEVHQNPQDLLRDNTEFIRGSEQLSETDKKKIIESAREWQQKGDLDLLRSAGLSLEQIKSNPLERHVRLAAMFLKRKTSSSNQLEFSVDFGQNQQAEFDLDLADLLPANILSVDIQDSQGQVIFANARRGFKEGKCCYITSDQKIAFVQTGFVLKINESQPAPALRDRRQGEQTYQNGVKEEMQMTNNARKTVVKDQLRETAQKNGQELITDKSFFDTILDDFMKAISPDSWKDLKLNFSKIGQELTALFAGFALGKTPPASSSTAKDSQTAPSSPTSAPHYFSTADQAKVSPERNSFKPINREWLLQNVGRSNAEVQRFMVPIEFMGAKMRVNKLIAPYLIEAEERIKASKIPFSCHNGDCQCQNWRPIRGGTAQSMHSWGTAIDLNIRENPWQPNLRGNNHQGQMIASIPPEVVSIMKSVGFRWGGDWAGPADPMHFELISNPYSSKSVLKSSRAQELAGKYLN